MTTRRIVEIACYFAAIAICVPSIVGVVRYIADPSLYERGFETLILMVPTFLGVVMLVGIARLVRRRGKPA